MFFVLPLPLPRFFGYILFGYGMFAILIFFHSLLRWFVLCSMLLSIYRAAKGYFRGGLFSSVDNSIRHWTATIAHVQLSVGMLVYTQSTLVAYFWKNKPESFQQAELLFYGFIHIFLMLIAVVFITVGSSVAKRKQEDRAKFKTMLLWFSFALLLIFIAIPWPFSPLAQRPFLR